MKKILCILLLFPVMAYSQHAWDKLNIDSSHFVSQYGSEYEWNIQENNTIQSHNKFRVYFMNAKAAYIRHLILYFSQRNWQLKANESNSFIKLNFTKYNNVQAYNAYLSINFTLNKDDRINNVSITGTPNDVIDFFVDYWEDYNINVNNLKNKKSAYIIQSSDKISFSWTGNNPVITISKGTIDFNYGQKIKN